MRISPQFTSLVFLGLLLLGVPVQAAGEGGFKQVTGCKDLGIRCEVNDGKGTDFKLLLQDIIKIFLSFVAIIAAAVLIYGGVLFLTSAGEEDRAKKAKNLILYAVIGLIIIGLSAVIVNFVLSAIN